MTLKPAAIACDGSGASAKVAARGSNRAKLRNGMATFYEVKLKADSDGEFALCVYCKGRNVVRTPLCLTRLSVVTNAACVHLPC